MTTTPNPERVWRVAIAGCGFFGQIQLEAWRRMPNVEVVAACDRLIERAQSSAPRSYSDARTMLDDGGIDVFDIATRPDTHRELVELAIEKGIPAIVQKALAPDLAQALAIHQAVAESGARVMVHENWRWQPWFRYIKQQLEAGAVGSSTTYFFEVRQADGLGPTPYPNQPYFTEMPRLLIFETLVHHIDTARFLYGPIESVFATASRRNPVIRGEDAAILVLRHQCGVTGVIDANRYINPEPPGPAMGEAIFEGETGRLHVNATGTVFLDADVIWRPESEIGYKGDSVYATQEHFIRCLATGAEFETGVGEYLNTFVAMEAAYQSVRDGTSIRPADLLP